MKKLILFNMVTADGYFEDSNGSVDWHHADAEFNEFAIRQLNENGPLLFGRKTFAMMQDYWTSVAAFENNPVVAAIMRDKFKLVVSETIDNSTWENTAFIGNDLFESVIRLKQQSDKDILMFGSATLAFSFRELGLIDEYRILVNPILIGCGKPLFRQSDERLPMKLVHVQQFDSGNILLNYEPIIQKYLTL
ncbi:MAG TPA: dihydrofolate reductase family protein [Flavobacterium sp.]|nr:dihydrofolate reductase family protein [Flavobacterium sp.]